MHKEQKDWCENFIKPKFKEYFIDKKVIEIGSLDVNGNNRYLFEKCEYTGVDVVPGKNVTMVCIAHELVLPNESFDVVFSTNALEHDLYYKLTFQKMLDLLKPKGLLFFSATHSFPEHGTLKHGPQDSGTSQMGKVWGNYFKNINEEDIRTSLDLHSFLIYNISIAGKDIRFWGIKKG